MISGTESPDLGPPAGPARGDARFSERGLGADSRDALEQRQLDRLRGLVREVAGGNRFYRDRWRAAGLDISFGSLDEFRGRFPFTRKHDLVLDQEAHPPYGTGLTYPLERYTRCHGTSGSSGHPLRWLDTPESWDWMLGNWQRVYDSAGVGAGDRVFFAFSFGPFLGFWTAFEAALRRGCLCLPGGGMTTLARLRSILEQGVTVVCGTPTYVMHLGSVARAEGMDLGMGRVRRLVVAGEPGGSLPSTRGAIEAIWPGARVVDHHGMTEVGPVSHGCPVRPGVLHVIEDSYLAEIVDARTGQKADPGDLGELVLTTLGRLGSPLIRYRTGDLVRSPVGGGSAARCACGSVELALEGGIVGRVDDMVVVRGVNVYPSAVEAIVRAVEGAGEYRVEVRSQGALLELKVDVEVEVESGADRVVAELESAFQSRLGLRIPVTRVETGSLPRSELKSRRWIRTGDPRG